MPVAALTRLLPSAHDTHDAEAEPLYCPLLQSVHAEASAPVAALVRCLPAAQFVHDIDAAPLN